MSLHGNIREKSVCRYVHINYCMLFRAHFKLMLAHDFTSAIVKMHQATFSAACVCLWCSVYMCDIHHHLQCCVWKAGLAVVVPCVMCLLSHVQASAALTRLQSQDAERPRMSIHKFTGGFRHTGAKNFSFFPSPLVPLSAPSVFSSAWLIHWWSGIVDRYCT